MVIFTCEPSFEAMMTCIYDAWDARLGHDNIRLMVEPVLEPELFAQYRHIDPDHEKLQKSCGPYRRKSPLTPIAASMPLPCLFSGRPAGYYLPVSHLWISFW